MDSEIDIAEFFYLYPQAYQFKFPSSPCSRRKIQFRSDFTVKCLLVLHELDKQY